MKSRTKALSPRPEEIVARLLTEIERTIAVCQQKQHAVACAHWVKVFFEPARKALKEAGSPGDRLRRAIVHLQVFGGMGSWTDVGPSDGGRLFAAYQDAKRLVG